MKNSSLQNDVQRGIKKYLKMQRRIQRGAYRCKNKVFMESYNLEFKEEALRIENMINDSLSPVPYFEMISKEKHTKEGILQL